MDGEGKHVDSREHAVTLDAQDPLSKIRKEFRIPSKAQLKAKSLPEAGKPITSTESLLRTKES
jgi:kynureninase